MIKENVDFTCSVSVSTPRLSYKIETIDRDVTITLTLENEEWCLLDMYPFSLYTYDGNEVLVSNLDIVNIDEYLCIKFRLPENVKGVLYFVLSDCYDVLDEDGNTKNITVKTNIYID